MDQIILKTLGAIFVALGAVQATRWAVIWIKLWRTRTEPNTNRGMLERMTTCWDRLIELSATTLDVLVEIKSYKKDLEQFGISASGSLGVYFSRIEEVEKSMEKGIWCLLGEVREYFQSDRLKNLEASVSHLASLPVMAGTLSRIEDLEKSACQGIGLYRQDLKELRDTLSVAVSVLKDAILPIEKDLHGLVDPISELAVQQRSLLRQMTGSGGTQDDEILEKAMVLKQQYSLTLSEAIERATEMMVYGKGR